MKREYDDPILDSLEFERVQYIVYIVEATGEVKDVKVLHPINNEIENKYIEEIKKLKYYPAKCNDSIVPCMLSLRCWIKLK